MGQLICGGKSVVGIRLMEVLYISHESYVSVTGVEEEVDAYVEV